MSVQRCSLIPPIGGPHFQADPDNELAPSPLHDKIVPFLRVVDEVAAANVAVAHKVKLILARVTYPFSMFFIFIICFACRL